MRRLRVNGHVANDTKGTIFCEEGVYFEVSREIFDLTMKELFEKNEIVINETLTIYYK